MPKQRPIKINKTLKKKGGCGCQSQNAVPSSSIFDKITGGIGPASLTNFDTHNNYTIPYNNAIGVVGADPIDPSSIVSTRIQPNIVGGKKYKKRRNTKTNKRRNTKTKTNKKMRKYNGGGVDYVDAHNGNIQSSFLQGTGAQTAANILHGTHSELLNSQPQFITYAPYI